MSRVTWIFGPSAAGKKTLIFSLADVNGRRSSELHAALGISSNDLVIPLVVPARVGKKSVKTRRRIVEGRLAILREVYGSSLTAQWLFHGQAIDIKARHLEIILSEFGAAETAVVYLRPSRETYHYRTAQRGLSFDYDEVESKMQDAVDHIRKIFPETLVIDV